MGADQSSEEDVHVEAQTEFRIKLKNPNELYDVCGALQTHGIAINAISDKNGEAVLWIPASPEIKAQIDAGKCMHCEIIPCAYEPKGTQAQRHSSNTTSYDVRNQTRSPPGKYPIVTWK